MIDPIKPEHHAQFLKLNDEFVHWLAPLDQAELEFVLSKADYARQIDNASGVMIGYAHDVDYPNHKNLTWLKPRVEKFLYIDRIIIDSKAQGRGFGRKLYTDFEQFARDRGYVHLACEVNTIPDNPGSHRFHLSFGFEPIGEQYFAEYDKAVRYYKKKL